MSNQQHPNFNLQFVKDLMKEWSGAARNYEREAEKVYSRLRSYLALYQFRITKDQQHDIREMLSQSLDEIEKNNLIEDMDNYLDGFCFKFDKSVLPAPVIKPTSVKIKIAPEETDIKPIEQMKSDQMHHLDQPNNSDQSYQNLQQSPPESVTNTNYFSDNSLNYTDLDFYQMQFFQ